MLVFKTQSSLQVSIITMDLIIHIHSCTRIHLSAPGKWGRTQMGSDGFNRILAGLYFFSPVRVRLVPLKTHDFKGFRPDFNRILTGL